MEVEDRNQKNVAWSISSRLYAKFESIFLNVDIYSYTLPVYFIEFRIQHFVGKMYKNDLRHSYVS